jgi:hypothetical protein
MADPDAVLTVHLGDEHVVRRLQPASLAGYLQDPVIARWVGRFAQVDDTTVDLVLHCLKCRIICEGVALELAQRLGAVEGLALAHEVAAQRRLGVEGGWCRARAAEMVAIRLE